MKYKVISADMVKNLITFLDEVQFDALASNTPEDMQRINFCNWAIEELMNSYDAYLRKEDMNNSDKKSDKNPQSKSRDTYVEETFMDWNLPEMTDEEYEKLVDQFDAFLRSWEKDYYKKNSKSKPKEKRKRFHKPQIEDVAEYMSLDEIKEYLLDDEELTDDERFELYYQEHDRLQKEKQRKKEQKNSTSYDKMLKDVGILPSTKNNDKGDNDVKDNK